MTTPPDVAPLGADTLLALIRSALQDPRFDTACTVFVEVNGDIVFATARIDSDGDIVIAPAVEGS
jgi:hypothetical protein